MCGAISNFIEKGKLMGRKYLNSILLVVLLTVFAMAGSVQAKGSVTLRFATFLPPRDVLSDVLNDWAQELKKRSDGKIRVVFYHSQSLVKIPEMLDAVMAGTADMAYLNTVPFPDRLPLTQIMGMPLMLFSKSEEATQVWWALYQKYPELQQEYASLGMKALFVGMPGPNQIEGRVPVKTLEDLKGLKAAVETREESKAFSLFGAAPVTLMASDKYTAMERGVVETSTQDYNGSIIWKTHQIAGSFTENVDISFRVNPVVINLKTYNSMPEDLRKIFDELNDGKYWSTQLGEASDKSNEKCKIELMAYHKKHNNDGIYVFPDAEKEKLRKLAMPINEAWIKEMEAKGLPGKAMFEDVQKMAADGSF